MFKFSKNKNTYVHLRWYKNKLYINIYILLENEKFAIEHNQMNETSNKCFGSKECNMISLLYKEKSGKHY